MWPWSVTPEVVVFQIQKVVIALGDYMEAECHACIGGTNVREDLVRLSSGVHVVVGTPGRVYDMINRRALGKLNKLGDHLSSSMKMLWIIFLYLT